MSWGRFDSFSPYQGPSRSSARRCPASKPAPCTVVVIDEEEDGDDSSDVEVFIIDGAAPPRCPARKGNGASGNVINIDDDEDVDGGTGWEKAGPSTSRASSGSPASMTPGRDSPGNRYGLDSTSGSFESDLSDGWDSATDYGGSSDCEILDDTAGTAREMWETAASKKKMPHGVHEREDGRTTAFTSRMWSEGLFAVGCNLDETNFSTAWKDNSQSNTGGTKEGPEHAQSSASVANAGHGSYRNCGAKEVPSEYACKGSVQNNSNDDHGPASPPNAKECSNGKERVVPEKTSEGFKSPCQDGTSVHNFVSANKVFRGSSSADRKDGSPPMSVSTPEKIDEKIPEGVYSQQDKSPLEAYSNTAMYSAQVDGSVRGQQKVPTFTSSCECSRQSEENCAQAQANLCACGATSIKSTFVNVSGSCSLPLKGLIHDPEELGQFASVQDASMIGDREKHKESIEFKRAAEEEWASRQRQLQIQAEEAKKLRKRKKAEAQRLLDMEKRQKQRLQEVRESQRKNEEAIQLKEQYRGVVRKELEDMERKYWDMTSILRALGIPVEGGEVKAYKQALLKFHPDRVSRNDIYQQVKAEETFKFISRLKEKLPRFS
ncbi:uncharacterized protein C2845_PM01G27960 [Panicum miliaceum]|uniref:J domain-containing protein n=1 Tax=Panicum miliaceum TaxID=4540 RepID=A0A3L6TPZ0_PANMI|nr:uncharacterized protein C2845_PM01G27960 [Panicum miliaceum]